MLLSVLWLAFAALQGNDGETADLWALKPVVRPALPAGLTDSPNPIDAFVAARLRARGLKPAGPADRRTLLRRVTLDLTGLPPTPAEQEAFLGDPSPDAYEKVVDRLLADEQHGVRYARHWLDVLRYADQDDRMVAAPGIPLWREWVIHSLNRDLPYDQFVRAQLTGYRSASRTRMTATGVRLPAEPRPEDLFALGFLARGATTQQGKETHELSIAAVETISAAFMGLTVACAKCHDHMYDPIKQSDYYSMKALFDPLVLRKIPLATPSELFARGREQDEAEKRRAALQRPLDELAAPYRKRLYEDRVAALPDAARAAVRKPERERTPEERKLADDYFPILRIDADKVLEVMPPAERLRYHELQKQLGAAGGVRTRPPAAAFWIVEVDGRKELEKSYVLTSGEPDRPEKGREVKPGWPFAPAGIRFPEGRVAAFSDWLTARENPLLARVAVNRLWQWHFGEGLQKTPNDFGNLGGVPTNPELLDWLAAEFIRRDFSMKEMHRLIVCSETYRRASEADAGSDPANESLSRFPLRRLEAEPIWDSILAASGLLDRSVGGPSFDGGSYRRAAYMVRGYSSSRDVMPRFLEAFDADDGRVSCPTRTRTVTAPQALFLMNSEEIDRASARFAERLAKECGSDLNAAVDLAYRVALARPPSPSESERSLEFLDHDPARLKSFAWLLFNLDEFVYVR